MSAEELKWLWQVSLPVCRPNANAPKLRFGSVRILKRRLDYVAKAVGMVDALQIYMQPPKGSVLQRAMQQRPELVGVVIWPYICATWDARTSLQKVGEHFQVIEKGAPSLNFPVSEAFTLVDLGDVAANLRVVLDQPKWLMREGLLAINLFLQDTRIYSLAFSFAFEQSEIVAYIGGLQGVDAEGIMGDYKELTKALHGMRPRDFLVESLRIFCRCTGVARIYAVSDEKRHHRSSYFGDIKSEKLFLNYNDVWAERGGEQGTGDFFMLGVETPMRRLDEIPSKKRSMYRRRYELLQLVEERMQASLGTGAATVGQPKEESGH